MGLAHQSVHDIDYPRWSESLRDGSHVLIRPVTPLDASAERRFIEELSPQARRFRFLGQVTKPEAGMHEWQKHIDPVTDAAFFAAVVREDAHERFVGVSRYSSNADGLRCECAVTVTDAWQNKGLGTLLMRHLIEVARGRGVHVMYSVESAENIAMSDLAHFLGFRTVADSQDRSQVIHELIL